MLNPVGNETLAVLTPRCGSESGQVREVQRIAVDARADLALLRLVGDALAAAAACALRWVREGQEVLMTGFPIGAVLGLSQRRTVE